MSYILDALKKSDKQRQQESVPDLNTVQVESPPAKVRKVSWPLPFVAIVVLNVLFALFFILRPDGPQLAEQGQALVPESAQVQPQGTPANELNPVAPPSVSAPVDEVTADHQEQVASEQAAVTDQKKITLSEDELSVADDDDMTGPVDGDQSQQDFMVAAVEEEEDPPQQLAAYSEEVKLEQAQAALPPEAEPDTSQPKESLEKKALHVYQLPDSIRQQLPDIHIDAHLFYKDKPASRFASINGKVMREGDILDTNLKVAEIAPEGVVFSFQKYLFYVSVF